MSTPTVNLKNVQGDIIVGLQKRVEAFLFGTLKADSTSIECFRKVLKTQLLPLITTTQDVMDTQKKIDEQKKKNGQNPGTLLPIVQINLGFSFNGLKKLGIQADEIPTDGNTVFTTGQKADAIASLGDPVDPKTQQLTTWSPDFLDQSNPIDLVILITAPDNQLLDHKVQEVKDGISQPAIATVNATSSDEKAGIVQPGVILLGQPTSSGTGNTPDPKEAWAKDSSYMAFRELQQLVPEFQDFCDQSAQKLENKNVSGDFIGARIVGRWKSGAPIVLAPVQDNPSLNRAQDFDFSNDLKQELCPYAAHIRKTNPRKGLPDADPTTAVLPHLMIRNGIPYGPELSDEEKQAKKTKQNRGLLFVSYQSQLESGFQFVQQLWCNNINFPGKTPAKVTPGFDLLIGQTGNGTPRTAQNINPLGAEGASDPNNVLTAPAEFIVPLGGEYFFMPSIQAISQRLGL